MIWPSTRLLMFAVLKAVTAPSPVRYTGTSCRCTGDVATETARGAAACAFCCLESALLVQPREIAQTAAVTRSVSPREHATIFAQGFLSERSFIDESFME